MTMKQTKNYLRIVKDYKKPAWGATGGRQPLSSLCPDSMTTLIFTLTVQRKLTVEPSGRARVTRLFVLLPSHHLPGLGCKMNICLWALGSGWV